MNKKSIALIGVCVLIMAASIWFVKQANNSNSSATNVQSDGQTQLMLKFSNLQASYPSDPEVCLVTHDDPDLKLDATDKTGIENAVVGTIIDIPAGTNVAVYVKTYDKTDAAGTAIYESTYGSYNFTAKKTNTDAGSNQDSWVVTKFVACKK